MLEILQLKTVYYYLSEYWVNGVMQACTNRQTCVRGLFVLGVGAGFKLA